MSTQSYSAEIAREWLARAIDWRERERYWAKFPSSETEAAAARRDKRRCSQAWRWFMARAGKGAV